jgi:hypothetical protein
MIDFMHWRKFDGSFASVCLVCRATIGNAEQEEGLAEYEVSHASTQENMTGWSPRILICRSKDLWYLPI